MAVGRLVPVKRFDALMDALAKLRVDHPRSRAVIVGEGYERERLEARRRELGADDWIEMPGKLSDDELVDVYRRAWVLVSSSLREGWGMTVTEAGACGTPAVATRIAGHDDAIEDGVERAPGGGPGCDRRRCGRVDQRTRRRRATARERRHAPRSAVHWEATASGTLAALVDEAQRHGLGTAGGRRTRASVGS